MKETLLKLQNELEETQYKQLVHVLSIKHDTMGKAFILVNVGSMLGNPYLSERGAELLLNVVKIILLH